jgi:hypothetical protein
MLKKGVVIDDVDDDDEVKPVSQNRATATLSTEEFFLRTQCIWLSPLSSREVWGGGGGGK